MKIIWKDRNMKRYEKRINFRDINYWTKEEFEQFLTTLKEKPKERQAFLLLFLTGMRSRELLALTHEDINLEDKTISITKSYQYINGKDVMIPPKCMRIIKVPDILIEEFLKCMGFLNVIEKKDRLFPFSSQYLIDCFKKGIQESGVRQVSLCSLRHSHFQLEMCNK